MLHSLLSEDKMLKARSARQEVWVSSVPEAYLAIPTASLQPHEELLVARRRVQPLDGRQHAVIPPLQAKADRQGSVALVANEHLCMLCEYQRMPHIAGKELTAEEELPCKLSTPAPLRYNKTLHTSSQRSSSIQGICT